MEGEGVALPLIRRRFPHMGNQGGLQGHRLGKAFSGGAHHALMHKRSEHRVVIGDAQVLQVVEGSPHACGAQPGDLHQFIRGDAFVRGRVNESCGDLQQLLATGGRDGRGAVQTPSGLLQGVHLQGRRKHVDNVLLPGEKPGFFQPREGGADPGVVGGGIPLEGSVFVFPQDFPCSGHHLPPEPILPIQVAQCPENALDLPPGEPGARR